jgi:hypothetical protein
MVCQQSNQEIPANGVSTDPARDLGAGRQDPFSTAAAAVRSDRDGNEGGTAQKQLDAMETHGSIPPKWFVQSGPNGPQ